MSFRKRRRAHYLLWWEAKSYFRISPKDDSIFDEFSHIFTVASQEHILSEWLSRRDGKITCSSSVPKL